MDNLDQLRFVKLVSKTLIIVSGNSRTYFGLLRL